MSDTKEEKVLNSGGALPDAENKEQLSRRTFLKRSGLAAIGVAVIPSVGMLSTSEEAHAEELSFNFTTLGESSGKTLFKMARDIYPHEKVPDKYYANVIAALDKQAESDANLKTMISTGVANLNVEAVNLYGKSYADVPGEGERLVLLYAIEQSAFFQKLRGDLLYGLYNNKEVWPIFGYQGSSWEKGGYLHRGFDDIDWLPAAS